MNAIDRLSKCKTHLLLKQPFFGILCSMTKFIEEKEWCPTMATDGKNIMYNTKFVDSITDNELTAVLLHEIMHCIYMHCDKQRLGSKNHTIWGYAADFAINYEIVQMGGYKLPDGGLYDEEYGDMTVEQIYEKICKDANKGGDDPNSGKGFDKHIIVQVDKDALREKLVGAYEAATAGGNERGHIPDGIRRLIKELKQAKVPWQRLFARYIGRAVNKDDYSFSKPNRRYLPHGYYLPDLRSHIIGNVVVAIDTSGSISSDDLKQFAGELSKISGLVDEVTVMTCDAEVHEVVKTYKFQDVLKNIEMKGGGGTDFVPVFNKIKDTGGKPELLIYLTDTYGSFPDNPPSYPVVWVSTVENGKVPWGQLISMK